MALLSLTLSLQKQHRLDLRAYWLSRKGHVLRRPSMNEQLGKLELHADLSVHKFMAVPRLSVPETNLITYPFYLVESGSF